VVVKITDEAQNIRIEVEDSGPGMSPDILARAGEPFFTTKDPGRGMGLGLFLTRVVLERIGGSVAIDSTPGQGTRVVLNVPVGTSATNSRIEPTPRDK
jgi:two-component system sensor histidine kinase RegB